jgi:hypothetical protein
MNTFFFFRFPRLNFFFFCRNKRCKLEEKINFFSEKKENDF